MGPHVDKGLGLGESAVKDGEGVAGVNEVGGHGAAHDAGADLSHAGGGWADGLGGHVSAEEGRGREGSEWESGRGSGVDEEVAFVLLLLYCIFSIIH